MSTEGSLTGDSKRGKPFDYDDILDHIGQFGKYQFIHFLLLCYSVFFPSPFYPTFTAGVPRYRCWIEGCDNETNLVFEPEWLNKTMPWNWTESKAGCQMFNKTWAPDSCSVDDTSGQENLVDCHRWVYDDSLFKSTIVTEFNLTCDNEWKQTFSRTMFMLGMLIGGVSIGSIADILGRKLGCTIVAILVCSSYVGTAFVPNYIGYVILLFICGLTDAGLFSIIFIWGIEAVGRKYRVTCGFVYQIVFGIGGLILGVIAYFVRDWRTLQLIFSVPMCLQIAFFWFLPESIRWLITKERYAEAEKLIVKAAKVNKKSVPAHLLIVPDLKKCESINVSHNLASMGRVIARREKKDTIDRWIINSSSTDLVSQIRAYPSQSSLKNGEVIAPGTITDIFRTPVLLKRILIMFLVWNASVLGYYGITFSAANLAGDFHLNFELSILVETSCCFVGVYFMDKFGRRTTMCGGLLVGGISCLITGFVPEDPPAIRMTFSLIGKFFGSLVLTAIYSFTSELFHTPTRTFAVGLCSTSGRLGGALAPVIANTGRLIDPAAPYIIFGCVNVVVGLLCLTLPETAGVPLPATLQEAKDLEEHTLVCFRFKKRKEKTDGDTVE